MRRKDREMNPDFAREVIDQSSYGSLALYDPDKKQTYSVNLSLVRLGDCLYFHSAKAGYKLDLLKEGDSYGLSFVSYAQVPDVFSRDKLQALAQEPGKVGLLLSRVFTTEYSSAHVLGRLRLVRDPEEINRAMEALCRKYTGDKMDFFPQAMAVGGSRILVYALDIQEIHGKRKKLDPQGEEMKWQRMD